MIPTRACRVLIRSRHSPSVFAASCVLISNGVASKVFIRGILPFTGLHTYRGTTPPSGAVLLQIPPRVHSPWLFLLLLLMPENRVRRLFVQKHISVLSSSQAPRRSHDRFHSGYDALHMQC